MNRCHTLYRVALRADQAYERAIKKMAGHKATRWTLTTAQAGAPAVRKAYKRMVATGKARARACDVMRSRGFRDGAPAAAASVPAPAAPAPAAKPVAGARRRRR